MKHAPLAVLALALGIAACNEIATSPQTQSGSDIVARYRLSNPPPPPIDTGATGYFSPNGSTTNLMTSRAPSLTVSVSGLGGPSFALSPFYFDIPVTYFLNKTDNAGFLHFGGNARGGDVNTRREICQAKEF